MILNILFNILKKDNHLSKNGEKYLSEAIELIGCNIQLNVYSYCNSSK